jgi:hypothetical protein
MSQTHHTTKNPLRMNNSEEEDSEALLPSMEIFHPGSVLGCANAEETRTSVSLFRNYMLFVVTFCVVHASVDAVLAFSTAELGFDLGSRANFLLYLFYTFSALFLAKPVIHYMKSKKSVFIGLLGMLIYVTSFFIAVSIRITGNREIGEYNASQNVIFCLGACCGGVGAGILWSAQSSYYTLNAIAYTLSLRIPNNSRTQSQQALDDRLKVTQVNFASIFAGGYLSFETFFKIFATAVYLIDKESVSWKSAVFGLYAISAVISVIIYFLYIDPLYGLDSDQGVSMGVGKLSRESFSKAIYRDDSDRDKISRSDDDISEYYDDHDTNKSGTNEMRRHSRKMSGSRGDDHNDIDLENAGNRKRTNSAIVSTEEVSNAVDGSKLKHADDERDEEEDLTVMFFNDAEERNSSSSSKCGDNNGKVENGVDTPTTSSNSESILRQISISQDTIKSASSDTDDDDDYDHTDTSTFLYHIFMSDALSVIKAIYTQTKLQLILPYQITFGFTSGFMNAYITAEIVSSYHGDGYVGLFSGITTMTAVLLAYPYSFISNTFTHGKYYTMLTGGLSFFLVGILAYLPKAVMAQWGFLFFYFVIYGFGRGAWENTNKAVIAEYFPKKKMREVAYASIYFTSGLSAAIGYCSYQYMTIEQLATLNTFVPLIAMGAYHFSYRYHQYHHRVEI